MTTRIEPADVFTPTSFPLEEPSVYAARQEAESALRRATSRDKVPIVFGEFGVGKTTLIRRFFLEAEREGRLINILSPEGKNLDDIARIALEELDYTVTVEEQETTGSSVEGSTEIGWSGILKARLAGRLDESRTVKKELSVKSPTDQGFLNVLADHRVVLVIDEMHTASEGFRLQLARMIKASANLNRRFPQIVVLGTTADAAALVAVDEGIDRLLAEIRVEPMNDDEARFVITDGMAKLELSISEDLVATLIRTAAGAPALLQEICLDTAEHAVDDSRAEIEEPDVEFAVREFLTGSRARLTQTYVTAIETTGPRRYRKLILRAMAESPSDFVTMDELSERVSSYVGEPVPSTALSGPLRDLKQPRFGEILRDVARPLEPGGRVYNLTAFKDPRLKAFIRTMPGIEDLGWLPDASEIQELPNAVGESDDGADES